MEISKHPEMGNIISSIRKIADEMPCDGCKALKDDLNGSKSRMNHWKEKYDNLRLSLQNIIDEWEIILRNDNTSLQSKDIYENNIIQINNILENI